MTETSSRRRRRGATTRFDNTRQRLIISILAALGIIIVLLVAVLLVNIFLPDVGLTLRLGGTRHGKDVIPRNTDIWVVDADGTLRFATLFFPVEGTNVPSSEVFTVAGRLVNSAEDILESKSFGALNASSEIMPGTGNDRDRVYEQFWLERDPESEAYGLDVLTANSPYINPDPEDPSAAILAMGASAQDYYAQVIVAVAFAPGTQIIDVTQAFESVSTQESLLRPYRRVNLGDWLVYYFDTTSLADDQTIRIRYRIGKSAPHPDVFEIDAQR